MNNTNNSKRNSKNYDSSGNNEKAQKEEAEKNKNKNISTHISDKELDLHMLNSNNIFNENKNKNNLSHSNIIQDYYQNVVEDNVETLNNQFNNINLSGNDINEDDKINYNMNNNYINQTNDQNNNIKQNIIETNNNIQNNPDDNINQNQNYAKKAINIKEQPKSNDQDLSPLLNNRSQDQGQHNSYVNNISPYIMNQPQKNINSNQKIPYSKSQTSFLSEKREEYLINNCVSLCKEQIECRQLQAILDADPSLSSNIIYPKIKDKIQEISFDQFGNYFIQKVISYLTLEQISEILYKKVSHNFRSFCFNQHGTRVIQKIFESIINEDSLLNYFNNLLTPNLKDFVIDQNASHLIIKYVNTLPSPKNDFVIQFLLDNSYELAMKKYSCCVLQKCIEYSNNAQKKAFLKVIATKSFGLFNDQYGNYVVQYCINLCDYEINKIFAENFLYNIIKFSTQKYSSNIIEKCMDSCDESTKEYICQKYCDPNIVEKLLYDNYGNYVLQKVINLSKEPLTTKYLEMIGPLMKNLSNYSFGQRLYNKLIASFPNLMNYMGLSTKLRKNKKFKNKKNKNSEFEGYFGNNINFSNVNNNGINNINMEEFVNNNIYVHNNYNMNNNLNNQNNNGQLFMLPGLNNYLIPFQLNNNSNNFNNINPNKIPLQNLLNANNLAMNNNIINSNYNNNFNNILQFQLQGNRNNNIDIPKNYYNSNH